MSLGSNPHPWTRICHTSCHHRPRNQLNVDRVESMTSPVAIDLDGVPDSFFVNWRMLRFAAAVLD
jgi:hypothetical protein